MCVPWTELALPVIEQVVCTCTLPHFLPIFCLSLSERKAGPCNIKLSSQNEQPCHTHVCTRVQEWDDDGGNPDHKKQRVKEAVLDLNRRLRQELATPATIHFYTNQV